MNVRTPRRTHIDAAECHLTGSGCDNVSSGFHTRSLFALSKISVFLFVFFVYFLAEIKLFSLSCVAELIKRF